MTNGSTSSFKITNGIVVACVQPFPPLRNLRWGGVDCTQATLLLQDFPFHSEKEIWAKKLFFCQL